MTDWEEMVERIRSRSEEVHIGLVGKYVKLHDAYLSVVEAMNHAGYERNAFVKIHWIDSETITKENVNDVLKGMNGIIIPGGFGNRGIEGMILAAKYARENHPLLLFFTTIPVIKAKAACNFPYKYLFSLCSKQKRILHYSNYIEKKQPIHPATYYHIKYIINYTYSYPLLSHLYLIYICACSTDKTFIYKHKLNF